MPVHFSSQFRVADCLKLPQGPSRSRNTPKGNKSLLSPLVSRVSFSEPADLLGGAEVNDLFSFLLGQATDVDLKVNEGV